MPTGSRRTSGRGVPAAGRQVRLGAQAEDDLPVVGRGPPVSGDVDVAAARHQVGNSTVRLGPGASGARYCGRPMPGWPR